MIASADNNSFSNVESAFFNEGSLPLFYRRSEAADAREITKLLNDDTLKVFGRVNIMRLMEKCLISITIADENDQILAYAGFSDFSYIPGNYKENFNYLAWMRENFEIDDTANYFNSLFLICFTAMPTHDVDCARLVMRVLFNDVPDLQNCFLICPSGISLNEPLITVCHPLAYNLEKNQAKWRGFVAVREQHAQLLHVREARVEDNDDLIPLFNERNDTLRQTFGEYFIAEFVKMQSSRMKCIVADVEGVAVGFMSVNSNFDPATITQFFELTSFNELREPHPDDVFCNLDPTDADDEQMKAYNFVRMNAFSLPRRATQLSESFMRKVSNSIRTSQMSAYENAVPNSRASIHPETDEYQAYVDFYANKDIISRLFNLPEDSLPQTKVAEDRKTYNLLLNRTSLKNAKDAKNHPSFQLLSMLSQKAHFKGKYFGNHSCVCIELFGIDPKFAQRSCDFLLKIFEMFPQVMYCIITVPHMVPEFPLLQRFTRVTPLLTKHIPHELYVFCSAGVLDSIIIRPFLLDDKELVKSLIINLKNSMEILKDLEQYLNYGVDEEHNEMAVFIAEVEQQIIGLSILRKEENLEYIRSHYELESFIYYHQHKRKDHAHLMHFVLNPIFNHYSKHFLKELMRQSQKSCFYYYFNNNGELMTTVSTVIKDMMPIKNRRQIQYNLELLGNNAPSKRITDEKKPFAILHINRKLVLEHRPTINARIVVVGASDTAIAFLESLVFTPHLRFNNLTLISPNGLPGEKTPLNFRHLIMSQNNCYDWSSFMKMGLKIWVNVVYGKVTALNRNNKMLTVNYKTYVPYDYLILCTGNQYLVTCPTDMDPVTGKSAGNTYTPPGRQYLRHIPRAIFTINDHSDVDNLLCFLNDTLMDKDRIVVHGNTLDAYCCINGLLCFGIRPNQIVFAISPDDGEVTCFNNPDIECKMMRTLNAINGLVVLRGVVLTKWHTTSGNINLLGVAFRDTKGQSYDVFCKILLLYNYRGVDYNCYEAINCSSLVFDRRLVIDANFRTNDPSIRAAGPLTKYQQIYYSEELTHSNYNSKEVGYHLASTMMPIFDPSLQVTTPSNEPIKLIPTYVCPKIESGVLPGLYNYLHVHKPKRKVLLKEEVETPDFGYELTSGSVDDYDIGYFRLHVNRNKIVQTITCFTKKEIKADNMICLYGLHHRFLNNLLGRWFEGLITDLYSYFDQPWAMLLYHDRFPLLRDEVREVILNQYIKNSESDTPETLDEFILKVMDGNFLIMEKDKKTLSKIFKQSNLDKMCTESLAKFILHNGSQLSMYAKPAKTDLEQNRVEGNMHSPGKL